MTTVIKKEQVFAALGIKDKESDPEGLKVVTQELVRIKVGDLADVLTSPQTKDCKEKKDLAKGIEGYSKTEAGLKKVVAVPLDALRALLPQSGVDALKSSQPESTAAEGAIPTKPSSKKGN